MKHKCLKKLLVVLMVFVALFSFCSFNSVFVNAERNTKIEEIKETKAKRKTYTNALEDVNSKLSDIENNLKKPKKLSEKLSVYGNLFTVSAKSVAQLVTDPLNSDYIEIGMNVLKTAANIYLSKCGLGGVSDFVFDSLMNFGENPQSELDKLKEHFDEQFDEVHNHLDDIQNDIAELSNTVDESTSQIIEALANAFEADYAKKEVIKFMTSAEGNFNYTQFKNFLYGLTDASSNPYYYNQSYYNILMESIYNNSSEEVIKNNYDELYRSLVSTSQHGDSNINMYYEQLLYNKLSGKESIQHYYYDYLLANSELLGDRSVAYEALQFALDLYKTALFADQCIISCNNYQLISIYEEYGENPSSNAKYVYGKGENDYITYDQLLQNINSILTRQDELEKQMAKDVAYILNMGGSVVINQGNDKFVMADIDDSFGNVQINQTIYLNKLDKTWNDLFEFDFDEFTYEWYSDNKLLDNKDASNKIDRAYNILKAIVKYKGEEIYSIPFTVALNTSFNAGSGSVDDPYVISSAEMFKLISSTKDGMNKHYVLINDIDFKGVKYLPIGTEDKPFNGKINGNGYTIKNIETTVNNHVGLFSYVGSKGKISNLNIENANFKTNSKNIERVYGGIIAAVNYGEIYNCTVNNSFLIVDNNSDILNKHIYTFAGGIAGSNFGKIEYCKVVKGKISGSNIRDYGSESDSSNTTTTYVGGLAAVSHENSILSSSVVNETELYAYGKSTLYDTFSSRHPYITVLSGGITAIKEGNVIINNVWSSAKNIKCKYDYENSGFVGYALKNNCKEKYDDYIPYITDSEKASIMASSFSAIIFPSQKSLNNITYSYKSTDDKKYNSGDTKFKSDNLTIFIDDKAIDYTLLGWYKFDTNNSDKENAKTVNVDVLFMTVHNGKTIIEKVVIPVTVEKNMPKALEIVATPIKTKYNKNEVVLATGGSFVLRYQDNTVKDVTNSIKLSYDTSKYGKTNVNVIYGELSASYEIEVVCNHSYKATTVNPTCSKVGYTEFVCEKCNDSYIADYIDKVPHSIIEINEIKPTCTKEGKGFDKYCQVCQKTVEVGEVVPPKGHNYKDGNKDATSHFCNDCVFGEEHLFKTTEYETEVLCTCVLCDYVTKLSVNSREKISKLPRVVVSDAFSLNGENEVTVYLELHSEVPITSAFFSVYFGEELELVSYTYGNILYKPSASAFKVYSDHLNVILAQAESEKGNTNYEDSNTLLKLVFKTPKDAVKGKEYPITIVNKVKNDNGGTVSFEKFTNSKGEPLDFISINGKIKVVDRLPGDIVGDGNVDLLDAVILSKYSVLEGNDRNVFISNMKNSYENFDISYGDVTLDNAYTGADVVQILRYIVGGYEAKILAKEFNIKLNFNDGSGKADEISAKYDENGKIIISNLPVAKRNGYRFDGWYYGFGNDAKKLENDYLFNYDAYEQTLYAHYTLNSISFNGNGATKGTMDKITYGNQNEWKVKNDFEKSSNVLFDSKYLESANVSKTYEHEFVGWSLSTNGDIIYNIDQIINLSEEEIGNITLYAIWKPVDVTLPSIERSGYKIDSWTEDKEGFNSIGTVSQTYSVTSNITIFAKWNVIKYTIVYDGNGFTSGATKDVTGRLHSAETNFQLAKNGFEKVGYHFKEWNTRKDGTGESFIDVSKVSYINTEKDNVVTLYAQWSPNKYNIVYNINKPNTVNTSNYKGKTSGAMSNIAATFDKELTIANNAYKIEGYLFKGWATATNGDVVYAESSKQKNLTAINNSNITLYAVWEVDPYTIGKYVSNESKVLGTIGNSSYTVYNDINKTPQLTCGGKVIVDWTACTKDVNYIEAVNSTGSRYGGGNNNLDILHTVDEVYFIGNPKIKYFDVYIYTVGYSKNTKLTIYLNNMNFGNTTINSWCGDKAQDLGMYLTLDCSGNNSIIRTSSGESAIINRKNLSIIGSGKLTIRGGNGTNATSAGGNGTDGGTAVIVDKLTVDYSGIIEIYGGNGGNGARGTNGANGRDAGDFKNATSGSNGTSGGRGGVGGDAIKCTQFTLYNKYVKLCAYGGNGGDGGDGGNGGDAGQPIYKGYPQFGGKGGKGGSCGMYGEGINGKVSRYDGELIDSDGSNGKTGIDGKKGKDKDGWLDSIFF